MPCLTLSTNVNLDGVDTSAILAEATRVVADVIDKPQNYVMVVLKGSVPICFGGTEQPAAYGELVSIGGIDPVTNKKISAEIATILSKKLSIPKSRFFLLFFDSKASTTFFFFFLLLSNEILFVEFFYKLFWFQFTLACEHNV